MPFVKLSIPSSTIRLSSTESEKTDPSDVSEVALYGNYNEKMIKTDASFFKLQ